MEVQNMEDNRRHRRIPLSTAAQVAKLGSGDRIEAEFVNISNYGASLKTTVPLQFNERVKVSMTLNKRNHFVHSEEVPGTVTKRYYFAALGKALAMNDTRGFVKIVAAENGRLLGIHIVGHEASNMIGEALLAIENKMTVKDLAKLMHPHPALCEALGECTRAILE